MANPSFERREFFHLNFLRHLGFRLSGRSWALKGGIAMRFFHRSQRLSEDMDLDVVSQVRTKTLEDMVDTILQSRSFMSWLSPQGIIDIRLSKPKQTETTQRWKIALMLSADVSLPTKVEFSRRKGEIIYAKGIPDSAILSRYKLAPFAAQFYDAVHMSAQKILALASPKRQAVRDLFDLHHLFTNLRVIPENVSKFVGTEDIKRAIEKVGSFSYANFKSEVWPYLSDEIADLYKDFNAFERLKTEVVSSVHQVLP
jgi:predicted nucleotidyltransferase component of viral defense system